MEGLVALLNVSTGIAKDYLLQLKLNNTTFETVSGNIMTHISDHFPQFIILRQILTTRYVLFPNVISQNLMNKSLLMVLQEKIWTSLLIENCQLIESLIYFTRTFHHMLNIIHPRKNEQERP